MSWRGFARALENITIGNCKICGQPYSARSSRKVDDKVICSKCHREMVTYCNSRTRKINKAQDEIEDSKSLKNNLNNFNIIIKNTNELSKYTNLGFNIFNPEPSDIIENWNNDKDKIILDGLEADFKEGIKRSKIATTSNSKITPFKKILANIDEIENEIKNKEKLDKFKLKIKELKYEIQIDNFIEDAKKEQFKGNNKKAINKYKEALYILKNMDTKNLEFFSKENKIEEKILELEKSL